MANAFGDDDGDDYGDADAASGARLAFVLDQDAEAADRADAVTRFVRDFPSRRGLVDVLLGLVADDGSDDVRLRAAVGLAELFGDDARVLPALLAFLAGEERDCDDDGDARVVVVEVVVDRWPQDERVFAALVSRVSSGSSPWDDEVRAAAVAALAGWPCGAPVIFEAAESHVAAAVRETALETLATIADQTPDAVTDVAEAALDRLAEDPSPRVRERAVTVLAPLTGQAGIRERIGAVATSDPDAGVRRRALDILRADGSGHAADLLVSALQRAVADPDRQVRVAAFDQLHETVPPGRVDVAWLYGLVRSESEPLARAAAARAAVVHGGLGDDALRRAAGLLRHPDADTRVAALRGLSRLGPEAVAGLLDVVQELAARDPYVRARQVASRLAEEHRAAAARGTVPQRR